MTMGRVWLWDCGGGGGGRVGCHAQHPPGYASVLSHDVLSLHQIRSTLHVTYYGNTKVKTIHKDNHNGI